MPFAEVRLDLSFSGRPFQMWPRRLRADFTSLEKIIECGDDGAPIADSHHVPGPTVVVSGRDDGDFPTTVSVSSLSQRPL